MNARKIGQAFATALLNLLAPERCLACEAPEPTASGFCGACGEPQPLLDVACHISGVPVFAGARYAEPLISAIHRFKYGAAPELCAALCRHSGRGIDLLGIEPSDVWVPVPLHPLRLAERGYNQAALIARELARSQRAHVDTLRLRRLRYTEQQAKRDRHGRAQNVAAAFRVRDAATPRKRVVLVDDVVTTGATFAACIEALRAAGDNVIGCVAVACATTSPE
ncbi:MAG TPA: double zinc ribbon domain-containing protein [Polyangiaceae bacterium]|nr:double zinc ribbon domain-containing protein [Polyangiaceae bacterium]HYQ42781.1 double zinc ribbon domain-containing protein [Polyangiaceae bacterium]